jgi:hypothetical protein
MPLLQQSYWFPAKKLKRASRKEASAWWNWRLWNLQVVRVNTHFPILQFSSKGGRRQGRSLKIYRERERERERERNKKRERERERDTMERERNREREREGEREREREREKERERERERGTQRDYVLNLILAFGRP